MRLICANERAPTDFAQVSGVARPELRASRQSAAHPHPGARRQKKSPNSAALLTRHIPSEPSTRWMDSHPLRRPSARCMPDTRAGARGTQLSRSRTASSKLPLVSARQLPARRIYAHIHSIRTIHARRLVHVQCRTACANCSRRALEAVRPALVGL